MIRAATDGDFDALARLNHEVQIFHARLEPAVYRVTPEPELRAHLAQQLAQPGAEALLFEEAGVALGYAVMRYGAHQSSPFIHARTYLYVDAFGVAPAARRRGVGRALMAAIDARARALDADAVELDVRAVNEPARAFYASLGFRATRLSLSRPTLRADPARVHPEAP